MNMAAAMGIELLSEEQYLELQKLGNFDGKTSSWLKHLRRLENSVGPSMAIFATAEHSWVTTVQNLTMPPGVPRFAHGLDVARRIDPIAATRY
jgi:hypothetical protein